jgi:Domain of unknown function (DUF4371)
MYIYRRLKKICFSFVRPTKYNNIWEKDHTWITNHPKDVHMASCRACNSTFSISNGGLYNVKSHANSTAHKNATKDNHVQTRIDCGKLLPAISLAEQVSKTEILAALKLIRYHQSFNSCAADNNLFKSMFPDSTIVQQYSMGASKAKYMIVFGIAPYIRSKIQADIVRAPFSVAFDETTNAQTKKQLDIYISYVDQQDKIVTGRYIGSKFLGHCKAEEILTSFNAIFDQYEVNLKYLVGVNMDGASVNFISADEQRTGVLNIGNNAFRRGLDSIKEVFDVDSIICDINFFFKVSAARR